MIHLYIVLQKIFIVTESFMDKKRQKYLESLAEIVRERRKYCGFSREELAVISSLHQNTISILERADHDMSIVSLIKIVSALGCVGLQLEENSYSIKFNDSCTSLVPRKDLLSMHNSELIRKIGLAVRKRREDLFIKLEDVADSTGAHLNTVWNCEKGLVVPTGFTLYRIYNSLGIKHLIEKQGDLFFE